MALSRRSLVQAAALSGGSALCGAVASPAQAGAVLQSGRNGRVAWSMYRHGPARTGVAVESTLTPRNVARLRKVTSVNLGRALSELVVDGPSGVVTQDDFGLIARGVPSLAFRWRRRVGKFRVNLSTPVIDAGTVYSTSSGIKAVRLRDGVQRWAVNPFEVSDCVGSPAVVGSLLFVTCRDGTIAAFDTATGRLSWQVAPTWHRNSQGDLWASPAVSKGAVYVATERLGCFDAATGRARFITPLPLREGDTTDYSLEASSVAGGLVLVPSRLGLTAIDAETGEVMWASPLGHAAPVAVAQGRAYVQSQRGLAALNATTGSRLWSVPFSAGMGSGLYGVTYANGVIFTTERDAAFSDVCTAYSAQDGSRLWASETSPYGFINGVAVSDGRLFLTDNRGELSIYALD